MGRRRLRVVRGISMKSSVQVARTIVTRIVTRNYEDLAVSAGRQHGKEKWMISRIETVTRNDALRLLKQNNFPSH